MPRRCEYLPAGVSNHNEQVEDDVHERGLLSPSHPPTPVSSCRIRSEWTTEQSGKAFPLNQVVDRTHLTSDDGNTASDNAYPVGMMKDAIT